MVDERVSRARAYRYTNIFLIGSFPFSISKFQYSTNDMKELCEIRSYYNNYLLQIVFCSECSIPEA